jgi:hypothetical protein
MNTYVRGGIAPSILTSSLDEVSVQLHASATVGLKKELPHLTLKYFIIWNYERQTDTKEAPMDAER